MNHCRQKPMTETVEIWVNGERRAATAGSGLPELLAELKLPAAAVLIEDNGAALARDEWAAVRLRAEDRVELLRIVAGG